MSDEKKDSQSISAKMITDARQLASLAADVMARRAAEVEQQTGRARDLGQLAAAFFLEVVRAGVPQGDAVTITGEYIRGELTNMFTRDIYKERTERDPLDK